MNTRERFNRVMRWKKPDRVPNMDFGYWDATIRAWHDQGLPELLKTHEDVERHLGLEGFQIIPRLPAANGFFPPFEEEEVERKNGYRIYRNVEGNLCRESVDHTSIPQYLEYAIESRKDWERLKQERLDPAVDGRISDVKAATQAAHAEGMPVRFDAGSLYGWLRNWMGVERISMAILTERKWIEEMMEHLTDLTLHLIEKILPGLDIDMAWWWEDMCYNRGPLISPKLFNELMVPRYRRITAELKKHGVTINILDCDGCIHELVPGWMDAGINSMFPIEALHTDASMLREKYGEDLLLAGGVDKIALARGKDAINREMDRLRPLVEQGGFIPTVDHRVPPDVTFENYLYFLERKREVLMV